MQGHPDLAALYERWAGCSSGVDSLAQAVLASYDFSTARRVVDVGGRNGSLLTSSGSNKPGRAATSSLGS
jgi:hypothetical protein